MALYVVRVPQATFQIPSSDGHPCLKLTVAIAKPITHAKRTRFPRLYRPGTHFYRLSSIPICREFTLILTLTDWGISAKLNSINLKLS